MPRNESAAKYLIIVLAAVGLTAAAAPVRADTPGHVDYTPSNISYRYDGKHGSFTGDAIYASEHPDGGNRLIWSLRLSPSVQAIIRGDMSCGAYVDGKRGYSDSHASIPPDYWWHSVVTDLRLDTAYRLNASCAFTAQNGSTTAPGRVDYTVAFTLHSS